MPELAMVEAQVLHRSGRAFAIATFFSQMGHVHILRPDVDLFFDSGALPDLSKLDTCTGSVAERTDVPTGLDKNSYINAVVAAKAEFEKGTLKKVVLARPAVEVFDRNFLPDLFLAAEATYPDSFIALVQTPLHGTWIGASPERLLIVENGITTIDSLAGTMPSAHAPDDPSSWGAKEREEQDLVTQHIQRRLEALGIDSTKAVGPAVKKVGHLAHLHTVISADLGTMDPGTLAAALHPTPAICGEPAYEAQVFIRQHEVQERGLYAGFWGPSGFDGRTEFHVNIRCMQVFPDKAVIHAGAGITSGSDPEREWEETELKAATWRRLIHSLPAPRIS